MKYDLFFTETGDITFSTTDFNNRTDIFDYNFYISPSECLLFNFMVENNSPYVSDNKTIYLISNGSIKRWPVSQQYALDANKKAIKIICSHNNACSAAKHECTCNNCTVISNLLYKDL